MLDHAIHSKTHRVFARASVLLAAILAVTPAGAVYNFNRPGVLQHVATYADGDYIYFTVMDQSTIVHNGCNRDFFVIHGSVPTDRRKAMLARLMLAWATKETINIGYDATGDCADGYIRVHRVG